jgi:chromosome segregation ATPase
MGIKAKWTFVWMLLFLAVSVAGYFGYTTHQLIRQRDGLVADLESEQCKFKSLQRKYAEEKAQVAAMQRAKLAVEGSLLQAQRAASSAEEEKAALRKKIADLEAESQRKTAKLEERIVQYAENLEKLKENRDQYKVKLDETVQLVKERNEMIVTLRSEKVELNADFQETTSGLRRCQKHNGRLTVLAEELVAAYENKGVGASLIQSEPFTQLKKVELEKLIQEYRDRIDNENLDLVKPDK